MRFKWKSWVPAALFFILALVLVPVLAGAQADTTVTATADKQFVKPGDSFTVTFSLTDVADMYNYEIDLPLGSLVTVANEATPWVEGSLFAGKTTQGYQNYLDTQNFLVPTAVLARSLQGDDYLTFTDTRVIGSITLIAGANDGIFTVPLQNVTNQTEAENAIVRFDDKTLDKKILYNAQPLDIVIDGTPPVIHLDPLPETVREEEAGTNVISVSGTVEEANLDTVKVNSQLATLDGNRFSCNVSLQDGPNVINVEAIDKAGNSSHVQGSVTFIASRPAAPAANPEAGTYAVGVWVRLATATPGAQIYYTTDNSTPTEGSTPYTDKITITSNTTIKAIAVKDGKTSNVATFEYVIEPAGPGDDALNQLASELVRLYNNMDDNDKAALEGASININNPNLDWEQLLAPVLDNLTDEAKAALGADPCAQLRYFILDGADICCLPNTNVDQVARQLKIFRSTYKPMVTRVFDGGITVEEIWNFVLAVQNALPYQFTYEDLEALRSEGFSIIEERLQDWVNGAIEETLNNPECQKFKDKLLQAGLNKDALVQTKDNLLQAADPSLAAAQAVVKAYIRSRVELVGKTTLLVGNTETYQLKALGVDLAFLLKWHSSNPAVADFTDNTQPSKLLAKTPGTTTVTAYWDAPDGLTKAWLKKFTVRVEPKPDITPPTIITATHNAGVGWLKAGSSFKVTVLSETNAFAYYRIGGGEWVLMAEHPFIKGKYQGTYTVSDQSPNGDNVAVEVKVVDQSENETLASLLPVKIDTVAPNAPGIDLINIAPAAKTATVTLNTADLDATSGAKAVELYRWSYRDQGWVLLQSFGEDTIAQGNITYGVALREGANRFGARAIDKAGNASGVKEVSYVLDTIPPVFTIDVQYNDGDIGVAVFASEDLSVGPNATYRVVDRETGNVLEEDNIALALVDPGLRKYTGTFNIVNTDRQLDITVTGTDLNGLPGTSIYSELPVVDIIGQDVQLNNVGLLVPPDAYFEAGQRIAVGDDDGGEARNNDLDVIVAKQFRPDGTEFRDVNGNPVYVAITFNYEPNAVPDPNKLLIYYYNPTAGLFEEWADKVVLGPGETIPVPPIPYRLYINPAQGQITIYTDHFSAYGVVVDNVPPVLTLTAPADGNKARGSVVVSGTSEVGATLTFYRNDVQVAQITLVDNTSFNQTVELLPNQENTLKVVAADAVGNTTTRTVTVTEESTLPTLELVSPTGDTTTTNSSIEVHFRTDALDVGVTVAAGGGAPQTVEVTPVAAGEFKATVPLALGANVITISATNENGATTRAITVTRQQPAPGPGGGGGAPAPAPGIGPEGGKVTGAEGKAVVEIPAGALDKKVDVTIKQIAPAEVPAPPANYKLASDIYEFGPAGTKFAKPVTLVLQYDPAKLVDAKKETLAAYRLDEATKTWVSLGGRVDEVKHTVTVEVDHFSKFAVMAEKAVVKPVFKDVAPTHWAWNYIEALVTRGVIEGYPDQTFRPASNVTRAEFAKMVVKALGLTVERPAVPTFADVDAEAWSYGYVEAAAKAGLVKGYAGKFRPNDQISRQEMAAVLVRALGKESEAQARMGEAPPFADATKVAAWAKGYIVVAKAQGLVQGYPDGTFGPLKSTNRAEAAAMVYRFLEKQGK